MRGAHVTISSTLHGQAINIVDAYRFERKKRLNFHFVVVPRADAHGSKLANFVIHQNDCNIKDKEVKVSSIPHWSQPGIIRRSESRGEFVRVLAFKGLSENLDARFKSDDFKEALNALGVALRVSGLDGQEWADYSECDIILAARNLTEYDASNKPASKLVNAWFGDVPALLGPEPAYLALRKSDLDFFVVRSSDDVISAVRRLQGDPAMYKAMVQNGRKRRLEFTDDIIAARWAEVLNGAAAAAFDDWQSGPWFRKAKFVTKGILSEAEAKRLHRHRFMTGQRILDREWEASVDAIGATPQN